MHTYIVFAGIFSLLVARHHNVDNLGSLAWSSPRHLAGAASLCFFFFFDATGVYKRIRTTFGVSSAEVHAFRQSFAFGNVHACTLMRAAAAQRCCALIVGSNLRANPISRFQPLLAGNGGDAFL